MNEPSEIVGGVASTVQLRVSLAVLPAQSVTVTLTTCGASLSPHTRRRTPRAAARTKTFAATEIVRTSVQLETLSVRHDC